MRLLHFDHDLDYHIRINRNHRFDISELDVRLLARANGMRFNCFWLKILDISNTGLLITNENEGFVTFRAGDQLDTTVDIAGKLFRRPIHVRFKIVREHCTGGEHISAWGLEVIYIEKRHEEVFRMGIQQIERDRRFPSKLMGKPA